MQPYTAVMAQLRLCCNHFHFEAFLSGWIPKRKWQQAVQYRRHCHNNGRMLSNIWSDYAMHSSAQRTGLCEMVSLYQQHPCSVHGSNRCSSVALIHSYD